MAFLAEFGLFVLLLHLISPSKCDDLQIFQNTNLSSDALLNIPVRLVALEQTMAIIVGELQEHRSSCKEKLMPEGDIVADINQGRFRVAEEKMLALNGTSIVEDIMRHMSANSDHDFGVLVNLAKGLNITSLKSRILLNLYDQAKESDHLSTANLIVLAKCLSEEGNVNEDAGIISISSFKKLLDKIAENLIATFVYVMKWQGDYQTNSKVKALAADIAEWRDVSERVMIGLVSRTFESVDSKKILEAVSNHTDAWQALVGVDTLIERLKAADSLKGSIPLYILSHINKFVTRRDLHSTVQYYARQLTDKIPDYIVKIAGLMNEEFGPFDSNEIFKEVCNQTDSMQVLLGVETFIEWLKDTDSFNGTIALDVASYLNQFVTRKDLNSIVQDYARRVRAKIPDCILKLTALKSVCFWNKHKKVFLVQSWYYYKEPLVSVVIGPRYEKVNTTTITRALWRPERKDDRFFFENFSSSNLHASNITEDGFKRLFSTHSKRLVDDKSAWILETAGDSCFLKNYWNNEYLFASDMKFENDDRKLAGTKDKPSGSADENPEFAWNIISC